MKQRKTLFGWALVLTVSISVLLLNGCPAAGAEDSGEPPVQKPQPAAVVFDANGGLWQDETEDAKSIFQSGANFVVPDETPSKQGAVFVGWYSTQQADLNADAALPLGGDVSSDTAFNPEVKTLYALYQLNAVGKVTVVFTLFQGGSVIKSVQVDEGSAIEQTDIPSDVSRPHYTRNGDAWYTATGEFDLGQSLSGIESVTLFAKWTAEQYTVTFRPNGGKFAGANSNLHELQVHITYPNQVPAPDVSHTTFTFERWNSQADNAGTELNLQAAVTADAEYYAIWTLPDDGLNFAVSDSTQPWLGDTSTIVIAKTGYYKIELWGAQGGPAGKGTPSFYNYSKTESPTWNGSSYLLRGAEYSVKGEPLEGPTGYMSGGRGAYVSGHIYLVQGDTILLRIGGARIEKTDNSSGGGFNGGGSGYSGGAGAGDGAGGGATDLRFGGSELKHRILVAGGGGGSADGSLAGQSTVNRLLWKGGFATIFGMSDTNIGGGNGCGADPGRGAQLAEGGAKPGNNGQSGTWGYGGNAAGKAESYGAGGGGWFGGGSGGQNGDNGSGGGGSSYISGVAGFIACAESSTDVAPPASSASAWTNPAGGFVQKMTVGTQEQIATSWTGKVFTHAVFKAGNEEMPKPDGSGETESGHEGPGSARITWVGTTDQSVDGD
ncbi:MAG: InlB B-repeat-containing protein [Spirochaetaceae bacterium]|nr:InlB B-repeat-containing protein [Spirochaetaceae bacterium]